MELIEPEEDAIECNFRAKTTNKHHLITSNREITMIYTIQRSAGVKLSRARVAERVARRWKIDANESRLRPRLLSTVIDLNRVSSSADSSVISAKPYASRRTNGTGFKRYRRQRMMTKPERAEAAVNFSFGQRELSTGFLPFASVIFRESNRRANGRRSETIRGIFSCSIIPR